MKKFFVFLAMMFTAGVYTAMADCAAPSQSTATVTLVGAPESLLMGKFSVSATKQVRFSKGNLQYQPSTGTWRFAEHQWEYVGGNGAGTVYVGDVRSDNASASSSYTGWIDMFGWGACGYDYTSVDNTATNFQPYSTDNTDYSGTTSTNYYHYGPSLNVLTNGSNLSRYAATNKFDWGVYLFPTGEENGYRTLTAAEWLYLFNTRANAASLWARAEITCDTVIAAVSRRWDTRVLILLPDGWTASTVSVTTGSGTSWTSNRFTLEQLAVLEAEGAVVLPANGFRDGTTLSTTNSEGRYWSSTVDNAQYARDVDFYGSGLNAAAYSLRKRGESVRLVMDVE